MRLGIFDSGVGGQAVAYALQKEFPNAIVITASDTKNVPYGDKSSTEVLSLTEKAIQPLLLSHCDIIILACNTATAVALTHLRNIYPSQLFIGIEPMIKPASRLTKTKVIGVCATPTTLSSERYNALVKRYAQHLTVLEPDCSSWAYMIENNQINIHHIQTAIEQLRRQHADIIILGCTHYHWIKQQIAQVAGPTITILEPTDALAARIRTILQSPS